MKIVSADFVQSAVSSRRFPPPLLPEVAFAGKSNVGKSSLINSLLNRKGLAKTSSVPGKTQMVNFFRLNEAFQFVDLPGYGFSQAPRTVRDTWERLVTSYLLDRAVLRGVVMIVDVRHDPGPLDRQMKAWLDDAGLSILVVANKVDKIGKARLNAHLDRLASALALSEPALAYSARTGAGRVQLWQRLHRWIRAPPGQRSAS